MGAMHLDVSNDNYHALPGTSSSNIRDIRDDLPGYMHGDGKVYDNTDAKLLGSAAHCFILEPGCFDDEYSVYPGKVRRGKQWEEFQYDNTDRQIITSKMHERILGMQNSLRVAGYEWMWGGEGVIQEASIWAYEENTRVLCKVRPDVYDPDTAAITDLKTTSNPHWEAHGKYKKGFEYSVRNFGYYIQHPFYMDMLNTAGVPCHEFSFLCVQSSEPYDVVPHILNTTWQRDGRSEYIKQLNRLRRAVIDYDGSEHDNG
jgi:hypothetical protein